MTKVILITGNSASGKTTVAEKIVELVNYPFFSKDGIKEKLLDDLGWSDVEWSTKVGKASIDILFYLLEQHLLSKQPIIVEANFRYDRSQPLIKNLYDKFSPEILEIHCSADPDVLLERYKQRVLSGNRHPGHSDNTNFEKMEKIFRTGNNYKALGFGRVCELDTTEDVDWETLNAEVSKFVS